MGGRRRGRRKRGRKSSVEEKADEKDVREVCLLYADDTCSFVL